MWAQLGSNQRPPDYESGATNQLSYGPLRKKTDCNISYLKVNLQGDIKKNITKIILLMELLPVKA